MVLNILFSGVSYFGKEFEVFEWFLSGLTQLLIISYSKIIWVMCERVISKKQIRVQINECLIKHFGRVGYDWYRIW